MKWTELAIVLASLAVASGCATAVPAMVGGSTTPKHRTDIGVGGAARVPLGDLKDPVMVDPGQSSYGAAADAGGVVPMAYGRYGLSKTWDLGLMVAGTMVRADARHETLLKDGSTRSSLVVGIAPYGGWITDRNDSGSGGRVGLEVPFTFGVGVAPVMLYAALFFLLHELTIHVCEPIIKTFYTEAVQTKERGTVSGMMTAAHTLAQGVGVFVAGQLMELGLYTHTYLLNAVVFGSAALLFLAIFRFKEKEKEAEFQLATAAKS